MSEEKLLVIDKDKTLVEPISGGKYVDNDNPYDQQLMPGVQEALAQYWDDGWRIVMATNQGGVAGGHKTLKGAVAEARYAMELTAFGGYPGIQLALLAPAYDKPGKGVAQLVSANPTRLPQPIDGIEQPPSPGSDSTINSNTLVFRKPGPGMPLWFKQMFKLDDSSRLLFVGDSKDDEGAAANAEFEFILAETWRQAGIVAAGDKGVRV